MRKKRKRKKKSGGNLKAVEVQVEHYCNLCVRKNFFSLEGQFVMKEEIKKRKCCCCSERAKKDILYLTTLSHHKVHIGAALF